MPIKIIKNSTDYDADYVLGFITDVDSELSDKDLLKKVNSYKPCRGIKRAYISYKKENFSNQLNLRVLYDVSDNVEGLKIIIQQYKLRSIYA